MRIVHQTMADAVAYAKRRLDDASEAEKWMVAIWSKRGNDVTLERTSHHFPAGDFDKAVGLLFKDLVAEKAMATLPDDPLPMAPGFGATLVEAVAVDLPEGQGGEAGDLDTFDHEGV